MSNHGTARPAVLAVRYDSEPLTSTCEQCTSSNVERFTMRTATRPARATRCLDCGHVGLEAQS